VGKFVLVLFPSVVLGALTYFFLGITIARLRNEGHFFSFPFGGYAVRDEALLASAATWMVVWAALLSALVYRKKSQQ